MKIKGRWFVDLLMIVLIFWGLSFYVDFRPNTFEKKTAYTIFFGIYLMSCFLAWLGSKTELEVGEEFMLKDEDILLIFRFMPLMFAIWVINTLVFKPYGRVITWANERLTINRE